MRLDNAEDIQILQKSADLCNAVDDMSAELGAVTVKLASAEAETARLKRQVDDLCKVRADFVKRASEAARVFARRGVIGSDSVDAFADQAAINPSSVFDIFEKMAETLPASDLGGPSPEFRAHSDTDQDSLWYGLAFGNTSKNFGTVD